MAHWEARSADPEKAAAVAEGLGGRGWVVAAAARVERMARGAMGEPWALGRADPEKAGRAAGGWGAGAWVEKAEEGWAGQGWAAVVPVACRALGWAGLAKGALARAGTGSEGAATAEKGTWEAAAEGREGQDWVGRVRVALAGLVWEVPAALVREAQATVAQGKGERARRAAGPEAMGWAAAARAGGAVAVVPASATSCLRGHGQHHDTSVKWQGGHASTGTRSSARRGNGSTGATEHPAYRSGGALASRRRTAH
jgi:hypothetical protein